jgi:hypothetical protein
MAAGATYEPIATTTASSGTTVTFSSVPQTYTDLFLVVEGYGTEPTGVTLHFNGDTNQNYSYTTVSGSGTAASSGSNINMSFINGGVFSTSRGVSTYNIMNYSNTTTYKTVIGRGNTTGHETKEVVGLWRSNAAISSVSIQCSNFQPTCYFTLYGIKAA